MAFYTCTLAEGQLEKLAGERGVSATELYFANLVHLSGFALNDDFAAYAEVRRGTLEELADMEPFVRTAEGYMTNLPAQLAGTVQMLAKAGALNLERCREVWTIVETIMAENDPRAKELLEEDAALPVQKTSLH